MKLKYFLRFLYKLIRKKEIWIWPQVKKKILWMGNEYGGFFVIPELIKENSIVYSVGVGEDISFDKALIDNFSCIIYAFDPSPKSIKFVEKQGLVEKFHFSPVGIYSNDGYIDFFLPKNPDFVSGSVHKEDALGEKISVPVKRISTILNELKHDKVDLLKMDIEGSEYDVVDDILELKIKPLQILVELHHRFKNIGCYKTIEFIQKMNNAGYKIAAISPSREEYTFVLIT